MADRYGIEIGPDYAVNKRKNALLTMQLAEAERQMQEQNALREAARKNYRPGTAATPEMTGTLQGSNAMGYFPGQGAGMSPEVTVPAQPGTPGSFDAQGFRGEAMEQGVDPVAVSDYLGKLKDSEKKALAAEIEELENAATWVLYGGEPEGIPQRGQASAAWLEKHGKDVSQLKGLRTPEEWGAALSPFIDQIQQMKLILAQEVSSRQIRVQKEKAKAPQRGSTAGIVTEKDAWRAYKDEVKRIEGLKAQSWDPDEIDEDAMIEDFIDTVVPEKFRPYVRKTRGTGKEKGNSASEYEEIKTLKGQKYGRKGDKWYGPLK